ncbi:hypothetical protein PC129_g8916 [Phytophthora cactorum]|uniref:Zinc finger, CCHC-type n=1 Tax=Phytophthora cactorum TaxID=29920 RepID=A0A8T1KKG2_9STRA|nr:hypothetical protein Pcac1_g1672 [Phytophthora cactorum]KAG2891181.1 hypothetical protein PC114_g17109 [Phytophthora cactorum]KAG2937452.1 hypothetical protein PC117_g11687 [Phytophthora cactorum]KAG3039937.1 hypothetical protein PC119_g1777 [Phytophthora cactorum]KAG3165636.1 hypothetical protein C6341_g12322 [Phytophthora cactorum]
MEEFMRFETHILAAQPNYKTTNHQQQQQQQQQGKHNRRSVSKHEDQHSGGGTATAAAPGTTHARTSAPSARNNRPPRGGGPRPQRSCFKCPDLTHSVFQCPQIKDYAEAKELYEAKTGVKARPEVSVGVARVDVAAAEQVNKIILPCRVMDCVGTYVKPDTGAEVSLICALSRGENPGEAGVE